MNFKEWFENKLTVGAFPILVNKDFVTEYNYVINVSDEFYALVHNSILYGKCKTFWFPMNEKKRDIGLNSIYGAMIILLQAEKENASVYLHCHSGRNRSRLVKACYYYMRTGEQISDPSKDKEGKEDEKYLNRLHRASTRGYIPPMTEMEEFLRNIKNNLAQKGMNDRILDDCKKTINNF